MQKVKEYLDKDKPFTDLLPDLCKNVQRTVEKSLDILKEFLAPDRSKPLITDPEKLSSFISRIGSLQISVIKSLTPGNHSFDLTEFEASTQAIISINWTALHPYPENIFHVVKTSITNSICKSFKCLLKVFGTSALHPKVFKICHGLCNALEDCKSISALLTSFLNGVGSPAADFVAEYLQKHEITAKVVKNLQVLACQEKITLGLCKKNSKKMIGNGHQTRHRKVVMKKTQNKLLKQAELDNKNGIDIEDLVGWIKLINLYLESSPLSELDLESVFLLQIDRLPDVLKYLVVETMFNYSVLYKKHIKKMKNVLEELGRDLDFRRTCRHYLFILGQIIRIS